MSGTPDSSADPSRPGTGLHPFSMIGLFVSISLMAACVTLLYLAMRDVMDLGGMVASGGPYAIEHPAPGWVWLFPVTTIGGIILAALYEKFRSYTGGPPVAILAWPALFLSMGYNFFDYGINPPGKGGLVWAWLVCGVLFLGLALLPVGAARIRASEMKTEGPRPPRDPRKMVLLSLWNAAGATLGVLGATRVFAHLAR